MTRRCLTLYLAGLVFLAGCGFITHDDQPPPAPDSASAVSARDSYGREVAKAFKQAAEEFRSGVPESQINENMRRNVQDLPESAWLPLMREMNASQSREAKATLLDGWASELRGGK